MSICFNRKQIFGVYMVKRLNLYDYTYYLEIKNDNKNVCHGYVLRIIVFCVFCFLYFGNFFAMVCYTVHCTLSSPLIFR